MTDLLFFEIFELWGYGEELSVESKGGIYIGDL